MESDYEVLLGSDGQALLLLQKEFPGLESIVLPSYGITYARKGYFLKLKMISKIPRIKKTIQAEKRVVDGLIKNARIQGIISDNRLGIRSKKVPSVFITHQINVLSGTTTYFSSKMHHKVIRKFDSCWVPDVEGKPNLSGKLGHSKKLNFPIEYIGPLSRMSKKEIPIKYDTLVLLSGPEPQRTLLEIKLMECFLHASLKVLLVQGVVEDTQQFHVKDNIRIVNYMQSDELEQAINESKTVVSRSGYTTVMDLAFLEKDAFFIPTPGQYEQKYIARILKDKGIVPSCSQKDFSLSKLNEIPLYSGLRTFKREVDFNRLFRTFERK